MQGYLDVLRNEFCAEEGSFLLKLRVNLEWDREAFSRVTEAMLARCQAYDGSNTDAVLWAKRYYEAQLPRWLAEGFWYMADFVKAHSSHPSFPRVYPADYYEAAYQRLWDLAEWFFTGKIPYLPGHRFEPL